MTPRLDRILFICLLLDLMWQLHALDEISISAVDHTGPMIEFQTYKLQCQIPNVVQVESLIVKWFKGQSLMYQESLSDISKTPEFTITPNRTDDGAQYSCTAELNGGTQLTSQPLDITVYYISISTVDHIGPMIESRQYRLQCHNHNVVQVESLIVKWFKTEKTGQSLMYQESLSDISKTPEFIIIPNRTDDGAQYSCTAELNGGAQLTSQPLDITVYFKPAINEEKLPSKVPVFRGYSVVLVCEAEGNPKPTISWSPITNAQVTDGNLTITETTCQNLVCTATNSVDTTSRNVTVILKEDYLPLIAGLVAVTVAVISVIFVFIYSIYYKTAKMGHYSLKDAKPSEQNGNIAQNGKVNPLPMKNLSQSDIFA